jgi:parvulin-like peptidyl-prolyl isomerase
MTTKLRLSLALGAFFVAAAAISACGGDEVPGNAVVRVGDQSIKKDTFDHWLRIAAISQQGQQTANATTPPKANIPDAPDYKACIAQKAKTAAKPAKGQPEPTTAQFKAQCKQEYEALKSQVLDFLIKTTWLDGEAKKENVAVTDKDVEKKLDEAKKGLGTDQDFQKFLTRAGLTEADVFYQQRSQLLEQKLTEKITKGKDKVTDAQVNQYYEKNKQRFAQPERRDLRIVLTKTKARAEAAKRALDGGQSWKAVAKTYSIDQASKASGGKLPGVAKGQQEKALDAAVFKAKKGAITGPVKTQFGYYVFVVTKVTAAEQQSLRESSASIKQILGQENQRKALETYGKDYRERWKSATKCRDDYTVADCDNAPKAKAQTTTVPPGGQTTPQQGTDTTTQK